jgi:hypothetical protein
MLTGTCLCGAVRWTYDKDPGSATACNCTACRRFGVLWIYDYEGGAITVTGETRAWNRPRETPSLTFNHCPACGCVVFWRGLGTEPDGRRRMAVNLRLADEPTQVMDYPIDHFDGLDSFDDLPRDGRTVRAMWF